jgi:hypothetical protein
MLEGHFARLFGKEQTLSVLNMDFVCYALELEAANGGADMAIVVASVNVQYTESTNT